MGYLRDLDHVSFGTPQYPFYPTCCKQGLRRVYNGGLGLRKIFPICTVLIYPIDFFKVRFVFSTPLLTLMLTVLQRGFDVALCCGKKCKLHSQVLEFPMWEFAVTWNGHLVGDPYECTDVLRNAHPSPAISPHLQERFIWPCYLALLNNFYVFVVVLPFWPQTPDRGWNCKAPWSSIRRCKDVLSVALKRNQKILNFSALAACFTRDALSSPQKTIKGMLR